MQDISLAFLVLSCDKYADLWGGYFHQLKKNFNLNLPIYFASNTKSPNTSIPLTLILTGAEASWGSNFKKVLERIDEKYVFVTLEDLYLNSPFSNDLFDEVCNFINHSPVGVKHLKYSGVIHGQEMVGEHISKLPIGLPYRVTLCGIWDREYLISFIDNGENPWQFEVDGSLRDASTEGYFALNSPICKTVNMVEKGFWIKKSIYWAVNSGVPIDKNSRPFKSWHQELISIIRDGYFNCIIKIDHSFRKKIVDIVKKYLVVH